MNKLAALLGVLALGALVAAGYSRTETMFASEEGKVSIESPDDLTCFLRHSDYPGVIHIFPCDLLEEKDPEVVWRYLSICEEFYDNACVGYDI